MTETTDIHRLLDQAFTGIEMTADAQDLKEEVRGNLMARAAELEAAGQTPAVAASRAIEELGDVRELMDAAPAPTPNSPALRHRVRPKPAFVVRVVLASVIATAALVLSALGATGVLGLPVGVTVALLGIGASAVGWLVGDSLAQETSANHPMPSNRAGGFYLASTLMVFGIGTTVYVLAGVLPIWWIVFAAVAVVGSIVLFAFLGATQTNRHKAWVIAIQQNHAGVGTRFEEEPETAARFGIYTVVIWILAFAGFIALTFTVGWGWSWLALLGGLAVMMLVLARMLFGPKR